MSKNTNRIITAAALSISCYAGTYFWYKSTESKNDVNPDVKPVAYVERINEDVHRKPVSKLIWKLLNNGEPVYSGEAIRTSTLGEVRIQFADSERYIDVEPESLIVISQTKGKEISLDLMDGSLFVSQGQNEVANANAPALTLNSVQGKVDLSTATASLSKTNGNKIDLQVLKGKAKIESANGQTKEVEQGKTAAMGAQGFAFDQNLLKIISPATDRPLYVNPEFIQPISFQWQGFPKNTSVTLYRGTSRKDLKPKELSETGEASQILSQMSVGKYYWKLVATDKTSKQVVAETSVYRLEVVSRFAPAVIFPEPNSIINKPDVTKDPNYALEFQWSKPEDIKQMVFELAKDPQFKERINAKTFLKETTFKQVLPDGDYFWRMSAIYDGIEKPIAGKINKFSLLIEKPKQKPKPQIIITWNNPTEKTQYFITQPTAQFSWTSEQKDQVKSWRIKLAPNSETLEDPAKDSLVQKIDTKDLAIKTNLTKPGRYIAMVEAFDENDQILAKSNYKELDVSPFPLLPAPKFLPGAGTLNADNQGKLTLNWSRVEGAKEYWIAILDKAGKEMRKAKFLANSTSLVNLLPGQYMVDIYAIDEYGRLSQKEIPRQVVVPDGNGLEAPKMKKLKVK